MKQFIILILTVVLLFFSVPVYAFTNASLKGEYWSTHFEYNTYPYHRSELGIMTFDGSGNYTFNGIESKEGVGADLPVSDTGLYSITSDGQISFDGYNIGRLSTNGEVVICSNVSSTASWEMLMMVKSHKIKAMPWIQFLMFED